MFVTRSAAFLFLVLALTSCENYNPPVIDPSGSRCTSGQAQLGVGDGFLEYLCGCTGATDGLVISQPANIVCHVPVGTTVFFQYIATETTHQIVDTGAGLSFPSSSPSIPNTQGEIYTHDFVVNAAGTYDFRDAYNGSLTGQIVAP